MTVKIKYRFSEKSWQYKSPGGWHFISLPKKMAGEIREVHKSEEEGWGRLKVLAKIGNSEWKTAIWFDKKLNTYLLPLKTEIRKKEKIVPGKHIDVLIWI